MAKIPPRQFQPVKSNYILITKDYIVPFAIILMTGAIWAAVFRTDYFALREIACLRDHAPCQDPFILAELEAHKGENIMLLKEGDLATKIREGNKTIRSMKLKKKLPATLEVTITSTTPKVALKVETNGEQWITFDDEIRAIALLEYDPGLPTVITEESQELQLGQVPAREETVEALRLALEISQQLVKVQSIKLEETTVTLTLEDGTQALLTTRKDTTKQLLTLQAILADDTIRSETNYHTIDVRYDQPVLKSSEEK